MAITFDSIGNGRAGRKNSRLLCRQVGKEHHESQHGSGCSQRDNGQYQV